MKLSSYSTALFLSVTVSIPSLLLAQSVQAQSNTFYCGQSKGEYVTMARTGRGNVPVIRWVSNYFSGSSYTPQKRCQMVSQKFEQYNQDGTLQFLTTGRVNGLPVICSAQQYDGGCNGVLFTLKPGQNPNQVLQDLMSVRNRASGPIKQLGGGSAGGNQQDSNAQTYINMENYLKNASAEASPGNETQPPETFTMPSNTTPSKPPTDAIW